MQVQLEILGRSDMGRSHVLIQLPQRAKRLRRNGVVEEGVLRADGAMQLVWYDVVQRACLIIEASIVKS